MIKTVDFNRAELLADSYFGSQDWADKIVMISETCVRYHAGLQPPATGSRRRKDLKAAAVRANALLVLLQGVDLNVVAAAMRPRKMQGPPAAGGDHTAAAASHSGMARSAGAAAIYRIVEVSGFMDDLARVAQALEEVVRRDVLPAHRPPAPDPITFGVEALTGLWREVLERGPTQSYKAKGFGAFALDVLGRQGMGFADEQVRQTVRRVLSAARGANL